MNKIAYYLANNLIKAMLMVLLVFIGMEIFILLASQFSKVGKGSYHLIDAFYYVLLLLPQQTYLLFPMAGLLGMLLGLSLLASHNELLMMRIAGLSAVRIARYALQAGLILTFLITLIGEGIGPWAKHKAETYKLDLINRSGSINTSQGLWLRQGNNFYYIHTLISSHKIAKVNRYQFDNDQHLQIASFASKGDFYQHQWHMQQVLNSAIHTNSVITSSQSQAIWPLNVNPKLLAIAQTQPDEMSLRQLMVLIHFQRHNHLNTNQLEIIFWQRLLQPLASLLLMALAIPWLFGSLRQVTTSSRLVKGTLAGFTFYMLNQLFPPLSQVYHFPPFIAVILPLVIFAMFGGWLFYRIK